MDSGWDRALPLIVFGLIVAAVFWWSVVRPQKRKLAKHKELIETISRGDRVVTAGGLHGEVVGLQDKTFSLEVAPDVRIRIERRAVRRRIGDEDASV